MEELMSAVGSEFADLSFTQAVQLWVRLCVAAVLGAILGIQRAQEGKAAGVRTHMLVAMGSAAFVAVPDQSGANADSVSRIIQGLVAGIGFLGAGCIMKLDHGREIIGLTTAAGVWLTAAVGAAAGMGREASAVIIGLMGWFTLSVMGKLQQSVSAPAEDRTRDPADESTTSRSSKEESSETM